MSLTSEEIRKNLLIEDSFLDKELDGFDEDAFSHHHEKISGPIGFNLDFRLDKLEMEDSSTPPPFVVPDKENPIYNTSFPDPPINQVKFKDSLTDALLMRGMTRAENRAYFSDNYSKYLFSQSRVSFETIEHSITFEELLQSILYDHLRKMKVEKVYIDLTPLNSIMDAVDLDFLSIEGKTVQIEFLDLNHNQYSHLNNQLIVTFGEMALVNLRLNAPKDFMLNNTFAVFVYDPKYVSETISKRYSYEEFENEQIFTMLTLNLGLPFQFMDIKNDGDFKTIKRKGDYTVLITRRSYPTFSAGIPLQCLFTEHFLWTLNHFSDTPKILFMEEDSGDIKYGLLEDFQYPRENIKLVQKNSGFTSMKKNITLYYTEIPTCQFPRDPVGMRLIYKNGRLFCILMTTDFPNRYFKMSSIAFDPISDYCKRIFGTTEFVMEAFCDYQNLYIWNFRPINVPSDKVLPDISSCLSFLEVCSNLIGSACSFHFPDFPSKKFGGHTVGILFQVFKSVLHSSLKQNFTNFLFCQEKRISSGNSTQISYFVIPKFVDFTGVIKKTEKFSLEFPPDGSIPAQKEFDLLFTDDAGFNSEYFNPQFNCPDRYNKVKNMPNSSFLHLKKDNNSFDIENSSARKFIENGMSLRNNSKNVCIRRVRIKQKNRFKTILVVNCSDNSVQNFYYSNLRPREQRVSSIRSAKINFVGQVLTDKFLVTNDFFHDSSFDHEDYLKNAFPISYWMFNNNLLRKGKLLFVPEEELQYHLARDSMFTPSNDKINRFMTAMDHYHATREYYLRRVDMAVYKNLISFFLSSDAPQLQTVPRKCVQGGHLTLDKKEFEEFSYYNITSWFRVFDGSEVVPTNFKMNHNHLPDDHYWVFADMKDGPCVLVFRCSGLVRGSGGFLDKPFELLIKGSDRDNKRQKTRK